MVPLSVEQFLLVAIFSEGHDGMPWLRAQSCAPRPTKKLGGEKKLTNFRKIYPTLKKRCHFYCHQGGILPADSFPFCASLRRRFATKTGFLIPEKEHEKISNHIFISFYKCVISQLFPCGNHYFSKIEKEKPQHINTYSLWILLMHR